MGCLRFYPKYRGQGKHFDGMDGMISSVSAAPVSAAAVGGGGGRNINRRRSAVYGFSPNTGLSIGALM